jgi:hypothetical protein
LKRSILIALAALFLFASPVAAAKNDPAECWFTTNPLTFHAINLPTNDSFSITSDPYPTGTGTWTVDGTYTFVVAASPPLTYYVWRRGGGTNLLKAGKQLNDYHVIAICSI